MKISIGSPRVLGIEFDNGISRVVEMEFKSKSPRMYHAFTVPSPMDLISEDGIVRESESFRNAFRDAMKRLKISADRAAFSVSSSRIINREISIPMVRESKIEALLYQNAADYFPVNIADYKLTYNILAKTEQNGKKQYKLLVCAVPRDIIRSYYQIATFLGLDVAAIDFAGNGVFQSLKTIAKDVIKDTVGSDKTELYISVYSEHAMLTFIREGTICLQRIISIGLSSLLNRLVPDDIDNGDLPELEPLLRESTGDLLRHSLRRNGEIGDNSEQELRTEALRPLVTAIRRSVEYYLTSSEAGQIEAYLVGGVSLYRGFSELLSNELEISIQQLETPLEKKYPSIGDSFAFTASEFFAPIGACMQPVNLANKQQAKSVSAADVFNDHSVQNTILAIGIVCFGVCAALGFALFMMSDSEKKTLEAHESQLRSELAAYGDTGSAKTAYNNALQIYNSLNDSINSIGQYLETYNDHFVEFLEEMERKMPATFRVVGMTVNENGVVMNICVNTKNEAAYVIQTLRNCASVTMGNPSNITITENTNVIGYNISALLDEQGHLIRDNLASEYADYSQDDLDALIPALQSGAVSPAEVYSNYTEITTVSYSIDPTVLSMIEVYKEISDNPLMAHADDMLDALLEYLNTEQPDDLSVFDNYSFVNSTIFPLSDYGIEEEHYIEYVEQMRAMGYEWETVFIKHIRTAYEETGSGMILPQETITTDLLSFTISLAYTGEFEEIPEESESSADTSDVSVEGSSDELSSISDAGTVSEISEEESVAEIN